MHIPRSILQQEIPIDGDLWAALCAPPEAEHTLAGFLVPRLRFSLMDVPHAEVHLASSAQNDLILFDFSSAVVPLLLVLGTAI